MANRLGSTAEAKIQEELCKLFSSSYEGVNIMEVTPFIAAMRMIKIEYGQDKPEVYKMLIAVLHDYNPFLGNAQYDKTVKYVKILLSEQPELSDYMVSIIPKPEDVENPGRTRHPEHSNVPFSGAAELLRQSMNSEDPKMKIVKFYNFSSTSGISTNESHSMSADTQAKSRKLSVHDLIRQRLQAKKNQSVHKVVSDTCTTSNAKVLATPIKKEPNDVIVQRGETTTTFDPNKNRPIILRKPDLPIHHGVKKLPTAEMENKRKVAGNQSFPYTQQVIFSDGRKQNFSFNIKTKDSAKLCQTKTVMVPVSSSGYLNLNSDSTNPLVCLQQMVSETSTFTPCADTGNVVVVRGKESPDTNDNPIDVVSIDKSPEHQVQHPNGETEEKGDSSNKTPDISIVRKPRRNSSDPIDLTVQREAVNKRKRKRSHEK